jgi:magnesium-transporting ATPase (P-type)
MAADAHVLSATALSVDESILTGESLVLRTRKLKLRVALTAPIATLRPLRSRKVN